MTNQPLSLEDLLEQERRLVFDSFTNDQAIALGLHLVEVARAGHHPLTIDVTRAGQQLFHAALPGTAVDNDRWVERKRAVVERFGHASLYMARLCEQRGVDLATRYQLDPLAFAASGGAFPITIRDVGVVGTVTVSGLPHEIDHALVVEALGAFLGPAAQKTATPDPAPDFYLAVGDEVVLHRVVTEQDLDSFADLSGDHSPNHTDEAAMAASAYKGRIAHGALLVAFTSACSTAIVERIPDARRTETPVSLGYDRIRFLAPVYIGDSLTLRYAVAAIDPVRRRSRASFTLQNGDGQLVCVGEHHLKWVPLTAAQESTHVRRLAILRRGRSFRSDRRAAGARAVMVGVG